MNILITGVNGFIGSALVRFLRTGGMNVYGTGRGEAPEANLAPLLKGYRQLRLGRDFDPAVFEGKAAVVHCAHAQRGKDIYHTNTAGTQAWFEAARDRDVKTQVFLTTYSARPGSKSLYGRTKFELEQFFLREGQPVVRPGLVLGDGGLFGAMTRAVRRSRFIPLLDGGRDPVPVISINALCRVIEKVLTGPQSMVYQAFQEERVTLRRLLEEARTQLGTTCRFLPIPSFLPLAALKILEALRIPFPIKSESITGLKEFREITLPSSLPGLGIPEQSLEEIVRAAL